MSTPQSLAAAADQIWRHWTAGTVIAELPGASRPVSRADGYAIQSLVVAKSSRTPTGWKIAATSKAGQAHIGVDGPLAGRLIGERTHRSGATIPLAGNRMRVAEPEFAFRFGSALKPRATPYTEAEVLAAVDALVPAIEVPDSRFADFARVGAAQLVADLACAHDFVLGEPTTADWRSVDLSRHSVHAEVAGRYRREGIGANVLGDPRTALTWLVNELSALGITLSPGEVVTTGTCMQPLEIVEGDRVAADFGAFGMVRAAFA